MAEPNGDHSHDLPVVKIIIEFDPNHSQLRYWLENVDYYRAIGHCAAAQFFMYRDLESAQANPQEAVSGH